MDYEKKSANMRHHTINKSMLILIVHKALDECRRVGLKRAITTTFPANPWFDEECKITKRKLCEGGRTTKNKKDYEKLIQNKKEKYVITRRLELIALGKNNPRKFWKELQQKRKQVENNITISQWLEYAKLLYDQEQDKHRPPTIKATTELFTIENINQGIKRLARGKGQDIDGLQA